MSRLASLLLFLLVLAAGILWWTYPDGQRAKHEPRPIAAAASPTAQLELTERHDPEPVHVLAATNTRVEARELATTPVEEPLERVFAGVVVDWRGDPVPHATVRVGEHAKTTGDDGVFEFMEGEAEPTGDDGSYMVFVTHADFAGLTQRVRGTPFVKLVLEPLPVLTGRVILADGREPGEPASIEVRVAHSLFSTTSGLGGVYRFDRLPVGRLVAIRVRVSGSADLDIEPDIELVAGQTEYVDLRPPRAVTVTGTVIDAASRDPIAGAFVSCGQEQARTGLDGRFLLASVTPEDHFDDEGELLLLFDVRVQVSRRAMLWSLRYASPPNASDTYDFEVETWLSDAELRGRLFGPAGSPLPGTVVYLRPSNGKSHRATSEDDGSFVFTEVARGPAIASSWVLDGSGYAWAQEEVELVGGESSADLTLRYGELGAIRGRVDSSVELEDLTIKADALASHPSGHSWIGLTRTVQVAADGSWELRDLVPVTWNVYADLPDEAPATPSSRLVKVPIAGTAEGIDFVVEPAFTISGKIDATGYPSDLVVAELRELESGEVLASTRILEDGRFFLRSDRAGEHRLVVRIGARRLVDRVVGPAPLEDFLVDLP